MTEFDPLWDWWAIHDETGRECIADAEWLNSIPNVTERWKQDGWTIIGRPKQNRDFNALVERYKARVEEIRVLKNRVSSLEQDRDNWRALYNSKEP